MLTQVVETRKTPTAVALKGPFARVLSNVTSEVFAAGEAQVAGGEIGAEEALALFLLGRGTIVSLVVGGVIIR